MNLKFSKRAHGCHGVVIEVVMRVICNEKEFVYDRHVCDDVWSKWRDSVVCG